MTQPTIPHKQGLYDPYYEHDACGVGFVVDLKGRKSHDLVQKAIQILLHLEHRGACGCEKNTGDGAGILLQTPDAFFRQECDRLGIRLPALGDYGAGLVFLPRDPYDRRRCEELFEHVVKDEGQTVLGWRDVPTDNSMLGPTAVRGEPVIRQLFIGKQERNLWTQDELAFERKLYVIRKRAENAVRASDMRQRKMFYVLSLSYKTIIYKGMLNSDQVTTFYPDLLDPAVETALAMVHSRFSTNTFPNWARAQLGKVLVLKRECTSARAVVVAGLRRSGK